MVKRNPDGTFKKGVPPNPKGRKPGKTPATQLKKVIADNMPDILQVMIEQAKSGDVTAGKALMDKVIPGLKPQALPISVPTGKTLPESGQNIVSSTMKGEVPPDIGAMLITALANQAKLIEVGELAKRIEILEKKS